MVSELGGGQPLSPAASLPLDTQLEAAYPAGDVSAPPPPPPPAAATQPLPTSAPAAEALQHPQQQQQAGADAMVVDGFQPLSRSHSPALSLAAALRQPPGEQPLSGFVPLSEMGGSGPPTAAVSMQQQQPSTSPGSSEEEPSSRPLDRPASAAGYESGDDMDVLSMQHCTNCTGTLWGHICMVSGGAGLGSKQQGARGQRRRAPLASAGLQRATPPCPRSSPAAAACLRVQDCGHMPAHDADIFHPTVASATALHRPRLQVRARGPRAPAFPRRLRLCLCLRLCRPCCLPAPRTAPSLHAGFLHPPAFSTRQPHPSPPLPSPPLPPQGDALAVLCWDERMELHEEGGPSMHPERPDRVRAVMARLQAAQLAGRCRRLPAREATPAEVQACHIPELLEAVDVLSEQARLQGGAGLHFSPGGAAGSGRQASGGCLAGGGGSRERSEGGAEGGGQQAGLGLAGVGRRARAPRRKQRSAAASCCTTAGSARTLTCLPLLACPCPPRRYVRQPAHCDVCQAVCRGVRGRGGSGGARRGARGRGGGAPPRPPRREQHGHGLLLLQQCGHRGARSAGGGGGGAGRGGCGWRQPGAPPAAVASSGAGWQGQSPGWGWWLVAASSAHRGRAWPADGFWAEPRGGQRAVALPLS